eukprot:494124_1
MDNPHLRSGTMVEHKTASVDFDDTIKQKKYRTDTMDTVDTTTTIASSPAHSTHSHSIFNVNTPNSPSNNNTNNNSVIPENDEINLASQLDKLVTNENAKLNNIGNTNNELNDDNIDEQLFDYNFRPIIFAFISILIICLPELIFKNNDMTKYYLHLIYLIINLIIFFILIPLYSKCIPESIDTIISNANRNVNRQQNKTNCIFQILYSIDALYNRAFNIRNISLSDDYVLNIDSKIHNSIAIVPAGIFLIISNILLLLCYLYNPNNYDMYMRNYASILVFSCVIIVSFTLIRQISVHFTQIKDDIRKKLKIEKYVYMERLEINLQTENNTFNNTFVKIIIYVISATLSVIVWFVYVELNNLIYDLTVCICIIYTMVFIHLVIRIIFMFNYAIIIIKQFSHPIKAKTIQEIIMYRKLRNYYFDFILYSFMNQINPILTLFFIMITIDLVYIYLKIEIIDYLLPMFITAVYVLFYLLYGLNTISKIYLLIKKNAKK